MSGENSSSSEWAVCYLCIGGTVTLGNILLALLSSLPNIGKGLLVLDLVDNVEGASKKGGACGMFGLVLLAVFYVLNFHRWRLWWGKTFATAIVWVLFSIAAVLTVRLFPWATTVCVLLLMTFMMLAIRRKWKKMSQADFAKVIGAAFLVWAVIMTVLWGLWVAQDENMLQDMRASDEAKSVYDFFGVEFRRNNTHCHEKKVDHSPTTGTQVVTEREVKVHTLCAQANSVILIIWAQPLIAALVDFATSLFFLVSCYTWPSEKEESSSQTPAELKRSLLQKQGMTLVVILTLLIGGLYVATYFTEISVNLTIPLLVVLFVGGVVGCAWLYVELKEGLKEYDQNGKQSSTWINDVKSSTWIQAMAVGSGFIPTFLVLEKLRQKVNGPAAGDGSDTPGSSGRSNDVEDDNDWTKRKSELLKTIENWAWSDILLKICILGEVFFTLQVLGTKVTYVFLAWLNSQLGDRGLGPVIGIAFSVGFLMFMLPPVPGVPVYIFCGIVVSLQGTDDIGFAGVCFVAISLSLTLKLSACIGQYFIGYFLGQSARVQHLIGIDTDVTKAIRRILNGTDLRKVSVLVGGPDWPTSVTCGILRVHLGRMLLGTLPCFFTASPCVLAGVFLADAKDGKEVPWHRAVGSVMTFLAGIVQVGSMLWATTTIWNEVYEPKDEPAGEPAPAISEELTKLRENEEAYNKHFREVQEGLDRRFWCVLFPAAGLILITGYSFAGFQSLLFENFSVSGDIDASTDSFGLGGEVLNIVKAPGWIAICFFLVGVFLHALYLTLVGCEAKKRATGDEEGTSNEGGALLARRDAQ